MHHRPFSKKSNAFTATAYRGNPRPWCWTAQTSPPRRCSSSPVATNLSEATFVLPPTPEGRAAAPMTACAS